MIPDKPNRNEQERKDKLDRYSKLLEEKRSSQEINELEYKLLQQDENETEKAQALKEAQEMQRGRGSAYDYRMPASSRPMLGLMAVCILMISIFAISTFLDGGGLTGYAVKEFTTSIPSSETYNAHTEKILEYDNVTGVKLSGKIEGTGARFTLRAGTQELLIGEVTEESSGEYSLSLDKQIYRVNDSVNIIKIPAERNSTMYIYKGEEADILDQDQYTPTEEGKYRVVEIISSDEDIIRLEVNFTVMSDTTNESEAPNAPPNANYKPAREILFTNQCVETCNMTGANRPILIIDPLEDSNVTITSTDITLLIANQAPEQTKTVPDLVIRTGEEKEIYLDQYFTDADDSTIFYEISSLEGITADITGSTLTLYSESNANEESTLYATDGEQMTLSNKFQIIFTDDETALEEPETPINTEDGENISVTENASEALQNETSAPIITAPVTINDCDALDPNERPLECLDNREYFQDQIILIQTTAREPTARITPIGNLLITGDVIEGTSITDAKSSDYRITYDDKYGDTHTTIWFDSATGNLYLAGHLYEENTNTEPSPGSLVLKNKKGIILAWADSTSGNLYLRGNIIPYRRDLFR